MIKSCSWYVCSLQRVFLAPDVYMALDVIPTDGIYPGTNLTWSVVAGDSSPTISSSDEGKFGKAIYFDGSRQRVDLGSGPR